MSPSPTSAPGRGREAALGRPRRGTRRRNGVLGLGTAAALILVTVVMLVWHPFSGAVTDLRGNPVGDDPGTALPPKVRDEMKATPDTGRRFVVPSVGLDVPLGALNAVNGVIQPPGFTSAYWVRNLGVSVADADRGTVFVVMHSLRNGGVGPGNYLIDVDAGRARVAKGSAIEVGGVQYTVTDSLAVAKTDLPAAQQIWGDTPDRLVVITCLQVPAQTASVDNIVLIATREHPQR